MKIVHAVADENGNARGGTPGDQTGKEIRVANWYLRDGGWDYYLEPKDPYLAAKAVKIGTDVAASIHFGYNKDNRKSGYRVIKAAGGDVEAVTDDGDFDCSSLVYSAYILAGCPNLNSIGYSGSIVKDFMATGEFIKHTEEKYLTSGEYAIKGGVYVAEKQHVCMCIENGTKVTEVTEVTSRDRVRVKRQVWIREEPKTGKKIVVAREGSVIEVYGTDEASGWYQVASGFITNNTRYVEKI